ncbi:hypothetical protein SCP_0406270 [Sparassis crispa]|uniref:Uncharacterized protein n=1 Tax=Sparassis crispa TaxID=139825 RepID=A0A401GJA2_9APHY|nr:hypothetical protein SCP_0406270 [Sparassis crispa]GBE82243.1 hypothetical protein SCP_0406270 [Sparassis crispa]
MNECSFSTLSEAENLNKRDAFDLEVNVLAQNLLEHLWLACNELDGVFLQFFVVVSEDAVAATLKSPHQSIDEVERKTNRAKDEHAQKGKTLRCTGIGAVAGGVLVGVTGGLAAPLVDANISTIFAWLGVGGTAAGLLASGLASSSVVCGALFGAYGSKRSAEVVSRYTREVEDVAIVPVRQPKQTLAVRLCVSGWLNSPEDVVTPWTVFSGDDTFSLQWRRCRGSPMCLRLSLKPRLCSM